MALESGTTLGPYEIVGLIGAGGMGEVYRARDPRLQRTVAIKILPPSFSSDLDRLRRFQHEARAAGSLNHPNIVGVYDLGAHDGSPYIVTEFLEGQTLRDKLVTPLPVERALDYATQVAKGLAAAHAKGILHRDLKPENVFITKDGRAKILDFGLAKSLPSPVDGATMTSVNEGVSNPGTVVGTAGYMSPEQVLGRPVDARSDIFSFGSVLYEVLAGRRAFQRESAIDTMHAIVHQEGPDTADLAPRVPGPAVSILRRCLAKDADERFQSASDLAFALSALSPSQVGSAAVPGVEGTRATRRGFTALLAGAIVAAASVAAGYWAVGSTRAGAAPSFRQLTFRRGCICGGARFAPDGQTVIYGAQWEGKPSQLFSMRVDTAESQPLPLPEAEILSVSTSGELAILKPGGTLARVPLGGSGLRDIAENVIAADWAPDGVTLAAVRREGTGRFLLEYPIGTVIFRSAEGYQLHDPRISPDGEFVSLIELDVGGQGTVTIVDRSGAVKRRSGRTNIAFGSAWALDGRELWFNASETGLNFAVHAMARDGRERVVHRSMGTVAISDISRNGRVLMRHERVRAGMTGVGPNGVPDRDLSWLDFSGPRDLSSDGKVVLFAESGVGAGARPAVFLRPTDGSPAVRLGDGTAWSLSPDRTWALVTRTEQGQLALLPTGSGEARVLPTGNLAIIVNGRWLPDGMGVVFNAREPGRPPRVYVQSITSGGPTPITPEGVQSRQGSVRPFPQQVLASGPGRPFWLYPIDGGPPVPAKGFLPGDTAIRWTADGSSMWTVSEATGAPQILRVDVTTGKRDVWRTIAYADPAGLSSGWLRVVISADGTSYVYGYNRTLADLYSAEGLR
jgi:hypothetical protein